MTDRIKSAELPKGLHLVTSEFCPKDKVFAISYLILKLPDEYLTEVLGEPPGLDIQSPTIEHASNMLAQCVLLGLITEARAHEILQEALEDAGEHGRLVEIKLEEGKQEP